MYMLEYMLHDVILSARRKLRHRRIQILRTGMQIDI